MRRSSIVWGMILLIQLVAISAPAQQDRLAGRWEGKIQSFQGERATSATFKKEGDTYTGVMPGMRPGSEIQLKDIKIEGSKVTAKADVETPQGSITINYSFTLEGDTLNGEGTLDFGGQNFSFEIKLKRATGEAQVAADSGQQQGRGQRRQRSDVPQPQHKQSIDYFVGQWTYKYIGRESALGPAPRECTVTFTKRADGKSAEGVTSCTADGAAHKETSVIVFDEATKMLSVTERLGSGVTLNSRGDWTSPIAIRFTIDPVKVKGQTLQLRRTIAVVSAHSFTITDELSEDGGPFVRLGNAVVSKVGAN
ncbi:MAG TPA: hypothetical protein VNO14_08420 [Blastocatellia bacterium]|nr:hypothetical protein [Blastocatellia bacterium]